MKKNSLFSFIACFSIFLASCTSTNEGYHKVPHDFSRYANLGEAIRSIGGVVLGGNTMAGRNDAVVGTRGQASIVLNTQPLYVVNNVAIGNEYSIANNLVHPANIVSIRIVRGSTASIIYGEDANHGAIIIRTKDYKEKTRGKI